MAPWRRYLGFAAVVVALAGILGGVRALESRGYDRCRGEQNEAHRQALAAQLDATLDEIERSNRQAFQLAEARTQNEDLRSHHAKAASALVGTCPAGLLTLHDAAATGAYLPDPGGRTLATGAPVEARPIGEALADNYANCRDCITRLNGWIDFWNGIDWKRVCP